MKRLLWRTWPSVLALIFVFSASVAQAQNMVLVPCGNPGQPDCDICYFEALAQNLLNFAIYVAVFIATIMIAYAGFKMITAQGDPGAIKDAKGVLVKVIMGLGFVLAAWLIVSTLMSVFLKGNYSWTDFGQCEPQPGSTIPNVAQQPGVTVGVPSVACTTCQTVNSGLPIKQGACAASQCQLEADLNNRLLTFQNSLTQNGIAGNEWTITEAYPPTRNHLNSCHQSGSCIDANFRSISPTASNVLRFQMAAQQAQLRAVYEVKSQSRREELIRGGVPANSIQVVPSATGEHFSVYKI